MSKTMKVKVTSAIVVNGRIVSPGEVVKIPKASAENLLYRGRAKKVEESKSPRDDLEEEYRSLGGRPQEDWTTEELLQRIEERKEKAEK